jgi:hypothetical protein
LEESGAGQRWTHPHNDNPAEIRTGAPHKIFWEAGAWLLVIQATKFVTLEIINVWTVTYAGTSASARVRRA